MAIFTFTKRNERVTQDHRSGMKLVGWVLVLPLVFVVLGVWQEHRAVQTLSGYGQAAVHLRQTLAGVQRIANANPRAILTITGEDAPSTVFALVAVQQLKNRIAAVDDGLEMSMIRGPFAWATIVGATLAFLAGAIGLWVAAIAGRRARRSRDHLINGFARLRFYLPATLAILMIGFSIYAVSALLFEAISIGLWDGMSTGSAKLFGGGLVLAGFIFYCVFLAIRGLRDVFTLFTPEPFTIRARKVEETEAYGLWHFVRDIAERQHALLPDTIIVGLSDGFFVTEGQLLLKPEDRLISGRTLHLPALELAFLDEAEVAAIIGHEFAHFAGEDTVYSQRFSPIYAGLWRVLGALRRPEAGNFILHPAIRLGYHAIQEFDHAVAHWSRLRELNADRQGALVSSPVAAASALIRTSVIAPVTARALHNAYVSPDDEPSDLVAEVVDFVNTNGFPPAEDCLETRQPHPTDSHPPTSQRIAALGIDLDDGLLEKAIRQPASRSSSFPSRLFSDWVALCQQLTRDFIRDARDAHARRRVQLEKSVSLIDVEEVVIYDNVRPMIWTMAIIACVFAIFALFVIVFSAPLGLNAGELAQKITVLTAATGVVGCLYAAYLHRGRNTPLMVLTPDSLTSSRLDRPIAWTDIANFQVFATTRFALRIVLNEGSSLPKKKWSAVYSKVERRHRRITIGALGVRGMKAHDFAGLIGRYRYAAYARLELQNG